MLTTLSNLKATTFSALTLLLAGSAPLYPTTSLSHTVTNGDFSQWTDNHLSGWKLDGDSLWKEDRINTFQSKQSLLLDIQRGAKAKFARITQDLELAPDQEHQLSLALAKAGTGKVIITLQALEQGRPVSDSPLPLSWDNIWSWHFPWTPLKLNFTTGSHTRYRLSIISHGYPGFPTWVENIVLESVQPLPREQATFYTQSQMVPFDAQKLPTPAQQLSRLILGAIPGEYESAFVGYHSPAANEGVTLRPAGSLVHESGTQIGGELIEVRMVAEQALLPQSRPRQLRAGENLAWWVTVKVPESTPAGLYRGELELTGAKGTIERLPFEVNVEAFKLPKLDIPAFIYHNESYFPAGNYLTAELRKAYYDDMKAHGMTTVTVYNTPGMKEGKPDLTRDYKYDQLSPEKLGEAKKRIRIGEEEWKERLDFGLEEVMGLITDSELVEEGMPVVWLAVQEGKHPWGDLPSPLLEETISLWLGKKEWPRPLLYVHDEPDGKPDRIAAAKKALERIAKLKLPVKTVTAGVPPDELGAAYDIWIQAEHTVTEKMLQEANSHEAQLWTYNCNIPNHHAIFTRIFFGFWAYRTEVKGIGLWAYYDAREWYADKEGVVHGKSMLSRICPSPNGPIPTTSWEAVREGVNDYRHALLFDRLLKEASGRVDAARSRVAKMVSEEQLTRWFPKSGTEAAATADQEISELDPSVREIVEAYRQWRPLEEMVERCQLVRKHVLTSIPYDAMAPMGGLPWSEANGRFIPVIGLGDPILAPEQKRASLRSSIRQLDLLLKAADSVKD